MNSSDFSAESAATAGRAREDFVGAGLTLLEALNTLQTADGRRLSGRLTFAGYEPWWFLQDDLLWEVLIPWTRNREAGVRVLAGDLPSAHAPEAIRRICSRLGLSSAATAHVGRPRPRRLGLALARVGLLLETMLALALARLRRQDTVLFILDSVSPASRVDFRLTSIYRELDRRGYRWIEYLHSRGSARGGDSWRNLLRRRRPAVYQNLPDKLTPSRAPELPQLERPSGLADADWLVLEALAGWHWARIHRLPDRIRNLRRLLRWQGARRAILTDDMRHVVPLILACRLNGVPTLGFQHGLFNRFHPTLMGYGFGSARRHTFDLYGVWSEYYRDRLKQGRLFDDSNSFATGPLRAPTADELERVAAGRRTSGALPIRVLIVSEPLPPRDQLLEHIRELLRDGRFRITWKLRPGEEPPRLDVAGADGARLRILTTGTVYEAFADCDVVLGTYSSVLYEGLAVLKPAVVLHTDLSYGYDIVDDGLADFVGQPDDAPQVVWRAAHTTTEILESRKRRTWGAAPGDGAVALFDAAEKRLWPPPECPTGA